MITDIKWIKIITSIFDDEKIKVIESLPESDSIIVIWFKLLCLAGKVNNAGLIYISSDMPYNEESLSRVMGRKIETVRLALKTFLQFKMIDIQSDIIIILNWEKHQSTDKLLRIQEQNKERSQKYRDNQKKLLLPINKDIEKELDIESNVIVTLRQIIDYLNIKANKRFTYKNDSYNKHIFARLKDGFTYQDFQKVIDIKIKDEYFMQNPKYLNPDTLFRPSNFEKYLNEYPTKIAIKPTINTYKEPENVKPLPGWGLE
jgi:predicted phage replisome organizer/uncharacterized phage protein (TIGR02220 family)